MKRKTGRNAQIAWWIVCAKACDRLSSGAPSIAKRSASGDGRAISERGTAIVAGTAGGVVGSAVGTADVETLPAGVVDGNEVRKRITSSYTDVPPGNS